MYRLRRWAPGFLLILPSLIAIGIFVYGFLGRNIQVSLSNWRGLAPRYDYVGFDNYTRLAHDARFTGDVKNVVVFADLRRGALVAGFLLALVLERESGRGFFWRFLFPMAISFIATAVIWRWLMSNASGGQETGLNKLFREGSRLLVNDWFKSNSVWAMAAVALAAGRWSVTSWRFSGRHPGRVGRPAQARVDGA
jgi:glucose/mannose transport system permease protein